MAIFRTFHFEISQLDEKSTKMTKKHELFTFKKPLSFPPDSAIFIRYIVLSFQAAPSGKIWQNYYVTLFYELYGRALKYFRE
jgi:hypothetical protein